MSDMRLLAQARLLLGHHPFTLADARALEALEEEAVGEEGLCIAELWESSPAAGRRGGQALSVGAGLTFERKKNTGPGPVCCDGEAPRWRGP